MTVPVKIIRKCRRLQGGNEGITLGPRAGSSDAKNIARPRVRLHHSMKKFAENRPGDTRALADRALSRSLTLLALILYTSALRGARGRASALSRMCTRAARRINLKHPQLSERRMIIKTRRTHPQIYSIRTKPHVWPRSEGRARAARVRGCEPRRDEHLTLSSRLLLSGLDG
jgi:hypothetical protein